MASPAALYSLVLYQITGFVLGQKGKVQPLLLDMCFLEVPYLRTVLPQPCRVCEIWQYRNSRWHGLQDLLEGAFNLKSVHFRVVSALCVLGLPVLFFLKVTCGNDFRSTVQSKHILQFSRDLFHTSGSAADMQQDQSWLSRAILQGPYICISVHSTGHNVVRVGIPVNTCNVTHLLTASVLLSISWLPNAWLFVTRPQA